METIGVPKFKKGVLKKWLCEAINLLVDPSLNFMNTFFEIAIEWEPYLRMIYEEEDALKV